MQKGEAGQAWEPLAKGCSLLGNPSVPRRCRMGLQSAALKVTLALLELQVCAQETAESWASAVA